MLGERQINETLINLENHQGGAFQNVSLSGFMPSPEFDFGLVDRNSSVWAQVEIRFDVELEGNAGIGFGPNPAESVVVRTFGWWAHAV
jgi:hypothetical protein